MLKIKVCGNKNPENLEVVLRTFPDFVGFIFYEKSKRNVEDPESLLPVLSKFPQVKRIGVFINESMDKILEISEKLGFWGVQLHGDETPEFTAKLGEKINVIKVFGMSAGFDFEKLKSYKDSADYFLFDTKSDVRGGSGQKFNWQILRHYNLEVPFLIAGGICLEDAQELKSFEHPQFMGVDINSGFEIEPGVKDPQLLLPFIKEIRSTD